MASGFCSRTLSVCAFWANLPPGVSNLFWTEGWNQRPVSEWDCSSTNREYTMPGPRCCVGRCWPYDLVRLELSGFGKRGEGKSSCLRRSGHERGRDAEAAILRILVSDEWSMLSEMVTHSVARGKSLVVRTMTIFSGLWNGLERSCCVRWPLDPRAQEAGPLSSEAQSFGLSAFSCSPACRLHGSSYSLVQLLHWSCPSEQRGRDCHLRAEDRRRESESQPLET